MYVITFLLVIIFFCLCCGQYILPVGETQLDEDSILYLKHCVLSQLDYKVPDTFDKHFLLWYYLANRNISIANFHTDYQLDKCVVTNTKDPVHVRVNSVLDKSRLLFNNKSIVFTVSTSSTTLCSFILLSICTLIMVFHRV